VIPDEVNAARKLRTELAALPARMRLLPLDARGYPVPWFVAWEHGVPEFRAMDGAKLRRAVRERRCWVCGQSLGRLLAFVVGPMCGVNRTSAEPPSHLECAEWSARNCPFLSRPHMVRREDDTINTEKLLKQSDGFALARNPGVTLVWITRGYKSFRGPGGNALFEMGEPERVVFYAAGRPATRAEVEASVESGLPALAELAELQREEGAPAALLAMKEKFEAWYPRAADPGGAILTCPARLA
jgi:hypothetical protein